MLLITRNALNSQPLIFDPKPCADPDYEELVKKAVTLAKAKLQWVCQASSAESEWRGRRRIMSILLAVFGEGKDLDSL